MLQTHFFNTEKILRVSVSLCLCVCHCLESGETQPAPAEKAAAAWSALPYLPPDPMALAVAKDVQNLKARFQKTGIWELVQDPEIHGALAHSRLAAVFENDPKKQLGSSFTEILNDLQGEFALALTGFLDVKSKQGSSIPDVTLAFQPRERERDWMVKWKDWLSKVQAQNDTQLISFDDEVAGAKVNHLVHPANPIGVHYTLTNGVFAASDGVDHVENLLKARQSAAAAPDAAAAREWDKALQRMHVDASHSPDVLVYADVERIRKARGATDKPDVQKKSYLTYLLKSGAIASVSYALDLAADGGIHEILYFGVAPDKRGALSLVLGGETISRQSLQNIPQYTVGCLSVKADPQKLGQIFGGLAGLKGLTTANNPESEDSSAAARDEFFSALTGDISFSAGLPQRAGKIGLGFPQVLLKLGAGNPAALEKALGALREAVKESFDFSVTEHRGCSITVAREKPVEGKRPRQLCWTVAEGQFIAAIVPLTLREEINRLKSGAVAAAGGGAKQEYADGGILSDADFKRGFAHLEKPPQALVYLDVGALGMTAYDLYVSWSQISQTEIMGINMNALPPADVFSGKLGGAVIGLSADAQGLRLESYSSTGLLWLVAVGMLAEHD